MKKRDFTLTKMYVEQLLDLGVPPRRIQSLTGLTEWELKGYIKTIDPDRKVEWPSDDE